MKLRHTLHSIAIAGALAMFSAGTAHACLFNAPSCQGNSGKACPTLEDRHVSPERCELGKEELIQGVSRMAAGGVEMAMRVMRAVAEEIDRQIRPPEDI